MPGIGKTASVLEVIQQLQSSGPAFRFLHFNAMQLHSPESIYPLMLRELTDLKIKSEAALVLDQLFTYGCYQSIRTSNCILLLDELDFLISKNQGVLYNIFEWSQQRKSRLTIVGIANTMNFPEKLLHKIASRIGNERLVFNPYTSAQIAEIIQQRLEQVSVFEPSALMYVSKKIATTSSDIRRTLSVCRKSVELCLAQKGVLVTIEQVVEAYSLLYSKVYHRFIRDLAVPQKVVLLAIAAELKQALCTFLSDVHVRSLQMMSNLGSGHVFDCAQTREMVIFLMRMSLLEIAPVSRCVLPDQSQPKLKALKQQDIRISMLVQSDEVCSSLKDDPVLLQFLPML